MKTNSAGGHSEGSRRVLSATVAAVVSCVSHSVLNVRGGYHPREKPHTVFVGDALPIALPGPSRLKLRFAHHYRIVEVLAQRGTWKVSTAGCSYSVEDGASQEIMAYHWHPNGQSPIGFPHLHISSGSGCRREEVAGAHFPTGRISVEEFLRLIIVDFHIEPLRPDWAEVFAEAQRDFELWRTWP